MGDFESVTGEGLKGTIDSRPVAIGNASLMQELGLDPGPFEDRLRAWPDGQTVMLVAAGQQIIGWIGVADPIRESTAEALSALQSEGIRVIMLTGDHRVTAEVVAKKLHITEVIAQVLPEQKSEVVAQLLGTRTTRRFRRRWNQRRSRLGTRSCGNRHGHGNRHCHGDRRRDFGAR